jgi:APA family basic amino acid/polyamine antiporter
MRGNAEVSNGEPSLKRQVTLFGATIYGIGNILGAGIYALVGEVVGITGNLSWLAFIIAASIGFLTGLSYAELSAMYPKSAAEFVYVEKAFRIRFLSFMVGWMVIFSGLFSAATVALSFGEYLTALLGIAGTYTVIAVAISLIGALSIINHIGIKESTQTNILFTLIEAAGLVAIIAASLPYLGSVDYLALPSQIPLTAVFSAVALIFFAYIGFEDIANIAEEVRSPEKVLPKAILYSVAITTVLYCFTSIAVVSILPYDVIASVPDPMNAVATAAMGPAGGLAISIVALFATANTVFIILIVTSRMTYGMSRDGAFPKNLGKVSPKRGTPTISILLAMVVTMGLVFFQDLTFVANATVFAILIAFAFVNLSLIALRRRAPSATRPFRASPSIGTIPVTALLGAGVCVGLLFTFEPIIVATQVIVIAIGMAVYFTLKRKGTGG